MRILRRFLLFGSFCLLFAGTAQAQMQTGSSVGAVTDDSGAVLPGVSVTVTGERLIGGPQTLTTSTWPRSRSRPR